jgi:hypothetical protein
MRIATKNLYSSKIFHFLAISSNNWPEHRFVLFSVHGIKFIFNRLFIFKKFSKWTNLCGNGFF